MSILSKEFSNSIESILKTSYQTESLKQFNIIYMRSLVEILKNVRVPEIKLVNYKESMNYLLKSFSEVYDYQKSITKSLLSDGFEELFIKIAQRINSLNESNYKNSIIYDQIIKLNVIMGYHSKAYLKIVELMSGSIFSDCLLEITGKMNTFNLTNKYIAFLYRKDRQYDSDEVIEYIEEALPTKIRENGMTIISKIEDINNLFQFSGVNTPFKISTTSISAVKDIVGIAATTKVNLSKVLTALYLLIYDGTGQFKRVKKMISCEDLEKLLYIKFLRHSKEHNQEIQSNSDKLLVRVGDIYRKLCDKSVPTNEKDYLNVQYNLYQVIIKVLDSAIDYISKLKIEELKQVIESK
jgi:predicted transcriptional regulator